MASFLSRAPSCSAEVGCERERGAGYVVKGSDGRVLGAGGDDVEDDVGTGAGSGRKEVVADQGVEVVGRDVAFGDGAHGHVGLG